MKQFQFPIFLFLLFALGFSACRTSVCENQTEPTLAFRQSGNSFQSASNFTDINRTIYWYQGEDSIAYNAFDPIRLPIDRDTMVYYFKDWSEIPKFDTLAIRYKRNAILNNRVCGYYMRLDSFELLESSSVEDVNFFFSNSTDQEGIFAPFNPHDLYMIRINDF